MISKTLQTKIWGSPLTAKERKSWKRLGALSEKKKRLLYNGMKKFFIDTGICSKDGKLISQRKLTAFRQMLAEQRKQRLLAEKASKKLKLAQK
jgi:hypothetical protein